MPNDSSFLGTGWHFPPRFSDGGRDVAMVSEDKDIEQSLTILLQTRRGERVMQDGFGCELDDYVFGAISRAMISRISNLVHDAILHHEPRIKLNRVDVSDAGAEAGLLLINIDYTVRSTNSRFNMVYPFYINEAIAAG